MEYLVRSSDFQPFHQTGNLQSCRQDHYRTFFPERNGWDAGLERQFG